MSEIASLKAHLMTAAVVAIALIMVFSSGMVSAQASSPAQSNASGPSSTGAPSSSHAGVAGSPTHLTRFQTTPNVPSTAGAASAPLTAATPTAPSNIHTSGFGPIASGNSYSNLAPWAQKALGVQDAATEHQTQLASYPNVNIVRGISPAVVNGEVVPFYTEQPAPIGIADLGIGANAPYAYNTSHFLGTVSFNSPPNATDPGSMTFIDPGAANDGAVGSPYEFGIQLNTILTNVTLPGMTSDAFWTQNVVDFNDTGIHFVDDIFNMSSSGAGFPYGSTFQYGACPTFLNTTELVYFNGIYQCVGSTIPITPADFPMTLQFYNNATVTKAGYDQITFGYNFVGANHFHATGIESDPTFTGLVHVGAPPVNFEVNGYEATPAGAFYDSELTFAGQIGGDNAVFSSLNGTMSLQFSNLSSGGWKSIPSAFNYGVNTGETATGVSTSWLSQGVEQITAGPSVLHGLWNTPAAYSASPMGDVHFAGTISPNFGFVFVTPGAANPLGTNSSWVPTNSLGAFNTYLPPLPGTEQYNVTAFAPGYSEYNGTSFSTNQAAYAITMTKLVSPRYFNAPLYADGDTQTGALAKSIGGTGNAPYLFYNLWISPNASFNHINDYGFPTFALMQITEDSNTVHINDSNEYGFLDYVYDARSSPPPVYTGVYNYTNDYDLWLDDGMIFSNETFELDEYFGNNYPGGTAFLWKDSNALFLKDSAIETEFGIFTGDSTNTVIDNLYVEDWDGVYDVGGHHTMTNDMYVYDAYAGVITLSSQDAVYENTTCYDVEYCFEGGGWGGEYGNVYNYYNEPGAQQSHFVNTNIDDVDYGSYLEVANGNTFTNTSAVDVYDYVGLMVYATSTDVNWFNVTDAEYGFGGVYSNWTNVTNSRLNDTDYGIYFYYTIWASASDIQVNDIDYGIYSEYTNMTSASNIQINDTDYGIYSYYDYHYSMTTVQSNLTYDYGIYAYYDNQVSIHGLKANSTYDAFYYEETDNVTVTDATFNFWYDHVLGISGDYGIDGYYGNFASFTDITDLFENATSTQYGVYLEYVNNVTATGLTGTSHVPLPHYESWVFYAYEGSSYAISDVTLKGVYTYWIYGVYLEYITTGTVGTVTGSYVWAVDAEYCSGIAVSGVTVTWGEGVYFYETDPSTVTGVTATTGSWAVYLEDSNGDTVSNIVVSNWSMGVEVDDSENDVVDHVSATNTTLSSAWGWLYYYWFGEPLSAVITYYDYKVTVDNISASFYSMGLYDYDSENLVVSNVEATEGDYGAMLNETYYSSFTNLDFTNDLEGLQMNEDAYLNWVTTSDFVDDTSYGVDIESGSYNVIFDNEFIGDNGAGDTYSDLHIQAFSVDENYFNSSAEIGNYWADWHSYNAQGKLNPYYVSDGVWDYYPLGSRQGDTTVYFYETGLTSGLTWSVTFNGVTQSTTNSWLAFQSPPGSSSFTIPAVAGFTSTPRSGTVVTSSGNLTATVNVVFSEVVPTYSVTIAETGLASGTSWSAVFNGVQMSGSTASLAFTASPGVYDYQVSNVSGYSVSPSSGTLTVKGNYTLVVTYTSTVLPTYTVTASETGLAAGTTWSAVFDGIEDSGTGSLTFTVNPGTYAYQIENVSGYTVSPSSGTATVNGNYVLAVTFTSTALPTYTVTLTETGLQSGANWSATFNGVHEIGTTPSLTFTVSPGTYAYQIENVSGYSVSPSSGTATVNGNYALIVAYSPLTYTVTVEEAGLAGGLTWSATVNGVPQSTAGTTLTYSLPDGTYTVSVPAVSGYKVSCGGGGSVTVNGAPTTVACQFTSTASVTPTASASDLDTYFTVAVALAAAALVVAVLALFYFDRNKRRKSESGVGESASPAPAEAASPPQSPAPTTTSAAEPARPAWPPKTE